MSAIVGGSYSCPVLNVVSHVFCLAIVTRLV